MAFSVGCRIPTEFWPQLFSPSISRHAMDWAAAVALINYSCEDCGIDVQNTAYEAFIRGSQYPLDRILIGAALASHVTEHTPISTGTVYCLLLFGIHSPTFSATFCCLNCSLVLAGPIFDGR